MAESAEEERENVGPLPYARYAPLSRWETTRWGFALASVASYAMALALPAYLYSGPPMVWYRGYQCLYLPFQFGIFGFLLGSCWFANPIYLAGLIALKARQGALAAALGFAALLFAISFLSMPHPAGVGPAPGFWFWIASMILVLIGGCVQSVAVTTSGGRWKTGRLVRGT